MESETTDVSSARLGGVYELLSLMAPAFLLLFIPCSVGFLERICLSRHSVEALEGSIQAIYILQIFQFPLINFANMAQSFIGKHLGMGEPHEVGPCIWQMGWISLLSMLLVGPLGLLASTLFLKGTVAVTSATAYFNTLLGANFLLPLAAALSSFYLVQRRTSFIIWNTLFASALNLVLDLILIFGIPPLLPSLGALGASLSVAISRLTFCLVLLIYFLRNPYLHPYQTNQWKIDFPKIQHYLRICTPRAIGRIFGLVTWLFTSNFMVNKGGDHFLVLSIGGTIILFCYFFADSLIQALTLIFSRHLGAQQHEKIWKSWWAGLLLVLTVNGMLSIPLLVFPDFILSFFFDQLPIDPLKGYLQWTLYWVWGWVFLNSLAGLFLPFLLAMQDTSFYMAAAFLTLITSALPVYFFINQLNWAPDRFWLILMLEHFIIFCLYSCRAYWLWQNHMRIARSV